MTIRPYEEAQRKAREEAAKKPAKKETSAKEKE